MEDSIPGKIPDVDSTPTAPAIGEKISEREPGTSFKQYMSEETGQPNAAGPTNVEGKPSPLDISKGQVTPMPTPSMESLEQQAKSSSNSLADLQSKLKTPNLNLNQSQKYLLRNKLSEANTTIRTAASKAGVEVGPEPASSARLNPVDRFLNYVTDSQNQVASIQQQLKEVSAKGESLNPGDMLLIQVKLNKAQQALDYSSVLLGKAVEDIKTLFNVQI